MKRKLSALAIAGTIGLVGVGGASAASALSTSSTSSSSDSLIDKLVEKFKLDKSEVKAVFDAEKTARLAERQAEASKRLQNAVDDGDITAAQKTAIENKMKELQTSRESARSSLEKWAEDNDVDVKYLMGGPNNGDDRLEDAVDDGDITEAQKTLIEKKREELETARDTQRDELEKWAKDNNIDTKYLMGGMKGGHGRGGI